MNLQIATNVPSNEEEGQELGVWRGGSQDSVPTSAAGSSLDSHAASSFELRSIGAEAAEVHQPHMWLHPDGHLSMA